MVLLLLAARLASSPAPGSDTIVERTRYTLADGTSVEGERIHTWDPSVWWHPTGSGVDFVCAPEAVGAHPDDRSLRVIPADAVADRTVVPSRGVGCDSFQPAHGRTLARSPLEGPARIIMGNEGYHLEEDGYGDFA